MYFNLYYFPLSYSITYYYFFITNFIVKLFANFIINFITKLSISFYHIILHNKDTFVWYKIPFKCVNFYSYISSTIFYIYISHSYSPYFIYITHIYLFIRSFIPVVIESDILLAPISRSFRLHRMGKPHTSSILLSGFRRWPRSKVCTEEQTCRTST